MAETYIDHFIDNNNKLKMANEHMVICVSRWLSLDLLKSWSFYVISMAFNTVEKYGPLTNDIHFIKFFYLYLVFC